MKYNIWLWAIAYAVVFTACNGQRQVIRNPGIQCSEYVSKEGLADRVVECRQSMIRYMKEAKPFYAEEDVDSCEQILMVYLRSVDLAGTKEEGMQAAKSAVLKLNALNDKCGGALIETMERETIAGIINDAGAAKGFNRRDEDITEAWRAW